MSSKPVRRLLVMKTTALVLSVLLNIGLAVFIVLTVLDGCAETTGRIGVLSRDMKVGTFDSNEVTFELPKGLVVREASAVGTDWFEPYRFRIVVTSEDSEFVNYDLQVPLEAEQTSEYYSADVVPSGSGR